jgi:MoaA/NifB/PqqE/SkfB family radical SAM enzyme
VSEFGLTVPQKFSSPLFVVWNFTNRCNLKCRHCYQDSEVTNISGELSLEEKIDFVDQMGAMNIPMLAISGGEPTLSSDLLPVIKRASEFNMHMSLATNGTTLTGQRCRELRDAGLRYIEISLDSVDAENPRD